MEAGGKGDLQEAIGRPRVLVLSPGDVNDMRSPQRFLPRLVLPNVIAGKAYDAKA